MATVTVFATGDEIGTYSDLSMSGNSNGVKLTLTGVEPLGSSTDVFRIVITQVNNGTDVFNNGQFVSIYAYPDTDPPSPPIYTNLNPQHDQFQGRASSGDHQIFTNPAKIIFDLNGVTAGTMQYGPGLAPMRSEQLSFDSFSPTPPSFPCFVAGTRIDTPTGAQAIETLRPGDLVTTLDHGAQPLRWIGQKTVAGIGPLAPIRIAAGALSNRRDLMVSPQHRMLVGDWRSALLFGEDQVLVAAKHLCNGSTIRAQSQPCVTYVHLMFDRHEVIFAEGIPSESLQLGTESLKSLGTAAVAELQSLFPDMMADRVQTARSCLRHHEATLLGQFNKIGVLSPTQYRRNTAG